MKRLNLSCISLLNFGALLWWSGYQCRAEPPVQRGKPSSVLVWSASGTDPGTPLHTLQLHLTHPDSWQTQSKSLVLGHFISKGMTTSIWGLTVYMRVIPGEQIQDLLFAARDCCKGLHNGASSLPSCLSGRSEQNLQKKKTFKSNVYIMHYVHCTKTLLQL